MQLRRYIIVEGELDAFAAWWAQTMPALRAQFGFAMEFAYAVPAHSEFVWAVSFPGSREKFDEAERKYNASPERAAIFVGLPERVEQQIIAFADDLPAGMTSSTTAPSTTQKG